METKCIFYLYFLYVAIFYVVLGAEDINEFWTFRAGYLLNCLDLVCNSFFFLRALYAGSGGEAAATMVVVDSSILFGFFFQRFISCELLIGFSWYLANVQQMFEKY